MSGTESPAERAPGIEGAEARIARFGEVFSALEQSLGEVIVGQRAVIRQVLFGLFADGHVLLEGVPGIGKTLLVKTLSRCLALDFSRIQFTPDLMPADIIGTQVLSKAADGSSRFEFQQGPIFGQIVLADEVNRATPKTQSALLEAMEESSVTVARTRHPLPRPFFVLATQNPLEMEGTYPLPEAQLDRFLFKIDVGPASVEEMAEILTRVAGASEPEVTEVAHADEILPLQQLAREVVLGTPLKHYISRIVSATQPRGENTTARVQRYVKYGSSPRGALAIARSAKVAALAHGRAHVSTDDVGEVCVPALRHRIALSFEGIADEVSEAELVKEVLGQISPP